MCGSSENCCPRDMYFDEKMLKKTNSTGYVDEVIVRVVKRDESHVRLRGLNIV